MTPLPVRIAPSLLAADFARLAEEIRRVEAAGADQLHLDIMDGHFVPNISFGLPVVEAIRRITELPFDAHLMISEPWRYLEPFRDAGANSLTVHVEASPDLAQIVQRVHGLGMECGLAVRPATPVEALFPHLQSIDLALVMSVEPGFGGQEFRADATARLHRLRRQAEQEGIPLPIQVDGGINAHTGALCRRAGANVLVAGSAVFRAPDVAAAIRALRG
ncbi:MAG: ribulose-phosphate 3-epimerase [Candidatus Latescibacterota bacterium]